MRPVISLWLMLVLPQLAGGQNLTLPLHKDSLRFAVIGDSGTGGKGQYEIGRNSPIPDKVSL